jgi:hypothetical protein
MQIAYNETWRGDATPLGKGEVHSSILCGSTSHDTSIDTENSGKFRLLPHARACRAQPFGLPPDTRTNGETLARVARFWHARRTRARPGHDARIDDIGIGGARR